MIGPPDYVPPRSSHALRDIPAERGRVGAMFVGAEPASLHSQFVPYVYRGTGRDTMPEVTLDPPRPKRRIWTKEQAQAAQAKRVAKMKRDAYGRKIAADVQRIKASLVSEKPAEPVSEPSDTEWLAPVIPLFSHGAPPLTPTGRTPGCPQPQWQTSRPKGPSPGWKPLKGADLDSLLDD